MPEFHIEYNGVRIIATQTTGFNLLSEVADFVNSERYQKFLKAEDSIKGHTKKKACRLINKK